MYTTNFYNPMDFCQYYYAYQPENYIYYLNQQNIGINQNFIGEIKEKTVIK